MHNFDVTIFNRVRVDVKFTLHGINITGINDFMKAIGIKKFY